jgi:hypothetical protein
MPEPAEPIVAAAAPPLRTTSQLADSLAGPLPPREPPVAAEPPPAAVAEPPAPSTRSLLAGAPSAAPLIAAPDPEERRLSHDLDFGESERRRRPNPEKGSARRGALILILLIILAIIAAMIFRTQIIAAVPATKGAYAAVGL